MLDTMNQAIIHGLFCLRISVDDDFVHPRMSIRALAVRLTHGGTKMTFLLCIDEPALNETSRECCHEKCAANIDDDARRKLLTKHMEANESDSRRVDVADHLRSKLVSETERYLSSPHSRSWARASCTQSSGVPPVRPRMPAA
jgi:hypothetical protein